MIQIDPTLTPESLATSIDTLFAVSAPKIRKLQSRWGEKSGTPVFTVAGEYTARGWTEWTQGFQYGSAILQFEATDDEEFLTIGREGTLEKMASHLTHIGVHDHGFNNVSTYGNLLRLQALGRIPFSEWEKHFYELALKTTGAVQAARWTSLPNNLGYIYSFNGPHSLFSDTVRSLRALAVSHTLGHRLMHEGDKPACLLERLLQHGETTARYNVYYGTGRDFFDLPDTRGRTVHESIFNLNDGNYRCPSTQQGYSPFSTWTRGLSWILTGYAEELEWLDLLSETDLEPYGGKAKWIARFLEPAMATADFFIQHTPTDGVPYWDTGAPLLHQLGDYLNRPAEPDNAYEPVDSSAAAIAAQGFLRLGKFLTFHDNQDLGEKYFSTGLTIAKTLFSKPYLSLDPNHEGLLLHSIYHQPNGWDYVPPGKKIAQGESSQWGDYHLRELAILIRSLTNGSVYHRFFNGVAGH